MPRWLTFKDLKTKKIGHIADNTPSGWSMPEKCRAPKSAPVAACSIFGTKTSGMPITPHLRKAIKSKSGKRRARKGPAGMSA
jgi:hypothetical protein